MIALHQTAPIGTIIKITNPMTQKSTFAKVVGKFAENESTKGVIILLTKTAAELLGALDKRFQVNLVYGVPDEQ
jgi:rare lipoprotein A (peptidoglycan hydrolase)